MGIPFEMSDHEAREQFDSLFPVDLATEMQRWIDGLRAEGAKEERACVRRDFLAWMRTERAEGRAMTPARFKRALDRICPE